ncbi:MAG: YceI family protein [Thermoanaerobaculia bacterium]|nr:YceI family protein [Thermoanaerobaculia bacterium]
MKSFRNIVLAAVVAALPVIASAETFNIDPAHSEAKFRVKHMMSNVTGGFSEVAGTVEVDRKNPAASSVDFTIKTSSVDTNNDNRDKHLRSAEFFDAEKYPQITFKSAKIAPTKSKDVYSVTGDLTIRGVTKQVTLPVVFLGFGKDPWGNERAGFEIETTLNRKDYGVNWNKALDQGGFLLGDDVKITLAIEAVVKK